MKSLTKITKPSFGEIEKKNTEIHKKSQKIPSS